MPPSLNYSSLTFEFDTKSREEEEGRSFGSECGGSKRWAPSERQRIDFHTQMVEAIVANHSWKICPNMILYVEKGQKSGRGRS